MERNRNSSIATRHWREDCNAHGRRAHDPQPAPAAALDFTPVPLRSRRDGWTPERQRLYVAALARTGHGGKAAAAVG
jgi:hypothetical protein